MSCEDGMGWDLLAVILRWWLRGSQWKREEMVGVHRVLF